MEVRGRSRDAGEAGESWRSICLDFPEIKNRKGKQQRLEQVGSDGWGYSILLNVCSDPENGKDQIKARN